MSKNLPEAFAHPYSVATPFKKSVAYFSMEFGIDQALKTYSGGLGFLAGSHMRAAHDLRQNLTHNGLIIGLMSRKNTKKGQRGRLKNADWPTKTQPSNET